MSILLCNRVMASLTIPEEDLPVLAMVASLDEPSFNAFDKALDEINPSLNRPKYLQELATKLPAGIKKPQASSIINVLSALYSIIQSDGFSASKLAENLANTLSQTPEFMARVPKDLLPVLSSRLEKLLSHTSTLGNLFKALDIMIEYERYYCGSRILSDIRPVFVNGPNEVTSAVVMHNLQLGFHDGAAREHHEVYVALDDGDLADLKQTIERAQQKSAALKAMLSKGQVRHIDV